MKLPTVTLTVLLTLTLSACRDLDSSRLNPVPRTNEPSTENNQSNQQNPGTQQNQTPTESAPPATQEQDNVAREPVDLVSYEQNTVDVVERYQDGVVFVTRFDQPQRELFNPLGGRSGQNEPQPSGSGSGFFVDEDGFLLTNYHVIRDAEQLTIKLHQSKEEYQARIVGIAPAYDLALLKAENVPRNLIRPMKLGDSSKLKVGQKAIAMGAPFGLEFTVTQGIVSATERVIPVGFSGPQAQGQGINQNVIQTDAAINPGNSGGPLVNSNGEVIGVNTQILSPAGAVTGVGQNAGVGFAVPINVAKSILPRLRAGERVEPPRIGVVGLPLQVLSPQARQRLTLPANGVLIQEVVPNSPAAAAGLRGGQRIERFSDGEIRVGGDVITAVDGQEVSRVEDIQSTLIQKQPGDRVQVTILRGDQTLQRELTLARTQRQQ